MQQAAPSTLTEQEKEASADLAYRRQARASWTSRWMVPKNDDDITSKLTPEQRQHIGLGGGADVSATAEAIGAAVAKHLENKTLNTRPVVTIPPPAGQGQPL